MAKGKSKRWTTLAQLVRRQDLLRQALHVLMRDSVPLPWSPGGRLRWLYHMQLRLLSLLPERTGLSMTG